MKRRLDLKLGFGCNNNCVFCAQSHKRSIGDRDTEKLKSELSSARDRCNEVVFTGGEPTIRKDLLELVSHAKNLGYEIIQIQSNGRMFAYMDFCKAIVKAGATEFSPALHGHTKQLHEIQTRCEGSFDQILQGIKNLRSLDQYVITNTVITKYNYNHLPDIAKLLVELDVSQFQLAFVHPVGNALKNFDIVVPKKSDAMPFVHRALDIAKKAGYVPGDVMIEAFPFCFMKGYEAFCSETFIPPAEVRDGKYSIGRFEEWRRAIGKTKFPQCKKCRYDIICEGPWKEYPERLGNEEFVPVPGKKIKNPEKLFEGTEIAPKPRVNLLDT